MLFNKKAQSTLEYAVVIAVVVAALIAMQAYVKRGMQGKLKQSSDDIGEQYSPGRTLEDTTVKSDITSEETVTVEGGLPTTSITSEQTQYREHSANVEGEAGEWWGD